MEQPSREVAGGYGQRDKVKGPHPKAPVQESVDPKKREVKESDQIPVKEAPMKPVEEQEVKAQEVDPAAERLANAKKEIYQKYGDESETGLA